MKQSRYNRATCRIGITGFGTWAAILFVSAGCSLGAPGVTSAPDPLEELAKLDPFAQRYRVDQVLERIEAVPYDADAGFSFVVWGDIRSNPEVFERLWKEIQKEKVVFAITTGDLVRRGTVAEWLEYFFPVIDKYQTVPFLPVVGNHDVGSNRTEYARIFGWLDYAFDYGNARFVVLDNNEQVSEEQLEWMERVLQAAPDKQKFVIAHKPPETIDKWAYHSVSEGADDFCALMTECSVTTVYLGHIHAYSTAAHEGVEYVISGGGGAGLHSRYGPMGNVHHYCVVTVKNGDVSHEVVRLMDGKMVRSPGGNEFYQEPHELLTPEVLAAVKKLAPEAVIDDVDIEREEDLTLYEVDLEEILPSGEDREIQITAQGDGTVVRVTWEVFREDLPSGALDYLREQYPREEFDEAIRVEEAGNSWLEVTLTKSSGEDRVLLFQLDGTFLEEDD